MNTTEKYIVAWLCEDEDLTQRIMDKIGTEETKHIEDVAVYIKELLENLLEDEVFTYDTFQEIMQKHLKSLDYFSIAEEFLNYQEQE